RNSPAAPSSCKVRRQAGRKHRLGPCVVAQKQQRAPPIWPFFGRRKSFAERVLAGLKDPVANFSGPLSALARNVAFRNLALHSPCPAVDAPAASLPSGQATPMYGLRLDTARSVPAVRIATIIIRYQIFKTTKETIDEFRGVQSKRRRRR